MHLKALINNSYFCNIKNLEKILLIINNDGTQFKVKLLVGERKSFVGKIINFNINGVFYNRLTDNDGFARFNIRLMPGQYIITSSYETAIISNTISIGV